MPVLSVTSGTGLTLMPECRCRTDFFSIPAFRHHKHLDVQDVTLPAPAVWACRVYPNPLLAVRTCKVFISLFKFVQCFQNVFLKCRNVGLSGISSVRYRNNQKYWFRKQCMWYRNKGIHSGTKMHQYQTELPDAGMRMTTASALIPMPSYG
jgi:hypothetical protein